MPVRETPQPWSRASRSSPVTSSTWHRGRAAPSPTTAEASSTQWRPSRSTVARSNRSVLYSISALSPPSRLQNSKVRSKRAASRGTAARSAGSPAKEVSSAKAFWRTTAAWTSGVRLGSRSGASASTRRSKGTSWWAKASSVVSRTSARSPAKERDSSTRERSTRVLTKNPIRSAVSRCSRPEVTVPSARSSRPLQRASSSWVRAVTTMKRLARSVRPSAASPSATPGGTAKVCTAPAEVRTAGRGRSPGSSSGSSPANCSRQ